MPVSSPKEGEKRLAFPDGSLVLQIRSKHKDDPIVSFSLAVTTPSNHIILLDSNGQRVTSEVVGDYRHYYFTLSSESEALPVGTVRVDSYGSDGINSFWFVTNVDNPHNKGQGSAFKKGKGRGWVYVLKGSHVLDPTAIELTNNSYIQGTTDLLEGQGVYEITFPTPLVEVPDSIYVTAYDSHGGSAQQWLPAVVSARTLEGFTVELIDIPPHEGYKLTWVVGDIVNSMDLLNSQQGESPLLDGVAEYTLTFPEEFASVPEFVFVSVRNTVTGEELPLSPVQVISTNRTAFSVQLRDIPDSDDYAINWYAGGFLPANFPGFQKFLPFPREFGTPPEKVMATITKDSIPVPIGVSISKITHDGFIAVTSAPILNDGLYRLEWVVWTKSMPIILMDFEAEQGGYHPV